MHVDKHITAVEASVLRDQILSGSCSRVGE